MQQQRHIYTISELTSNIKVILEDNFSLIWVSGEINNFSIPSSGHFYFTLKDENAQISAVMFRGQNRHIKFVPENGMKVMGFGRISVYEPRGTYQIILEQMEPKGIGALQIAFEQLKQKLQMEGLFDEKRKKPIPFLPKKISVITSPTGAVIHDIIKIINRRFPNVHIQILPVKVQGNGAEAEISSAIRLLNDKCESDVAILARGGGSFEDLQAFNTEIVARAIFASKIPIISAIGHETDYTIADFVADLRAPTPSAAAELSVQRKDELTRKVNELTLYLKTRIYKHIDKLRSKVNEFSNRLISPQRRIQDQRLRIDDLTSRLNSIFRLVINKKQSKLRELNGKLNALSPLAILNRGYSITRTIPEEIIIRNPNQVNIGQKIEIRLSEGVLICCVEEKL